ncbi:TPA: DeoR/GlpR transcriptional regulator, partial [Citrobacter freundii]|nr:DeoR/GlpR transcriptional regulator [Citrobacter freundii]
MISSCTSNFFNNIHADKVFLSTQGINEAGELTVPKLPDAHVKQALLRAGRQKILLADKSKFEQTFLAGHGRIADFNYIISQSGVPDTLTAQLNGHVQLLLADTPS